jgi:hypothetical protein
MMGFGVEVERACLFELLRASDVVQKMRGFFAMKNCRGMTS